MKYCHLFHTIGANVLSFWSTSIQAACNSCDGSMSTWITKCDDKKRRHCTQKDVYMETFIGKIWWLVSVPPGGVMSIGQEISIWNLKPYKIVFHEKKSWVPKSRSSYYSWSVRDFSSNCGVGLRTMGSLSLSLSCVLQQQYLSLTPRPPLCISLF